MDIEKNTSPARGILAAVAVGVLSWVLLFALLRSFAAFAALAVVVCALALVGAHGWDQVDRNDDDGPEQRLSC